MNKLILISVLVAALVAVVSANYQSYQMNRKINNQINSAMGLPPIRDYSYYGRRHQRRGPNPLVLAMVASKLKNFQGGQGGKAQGVSARKFAQDKSLSAQIDASWKTEMDETNEWKNQQVSKTKMFKNSGHLHGLIGTDKKYRNKSVYLRKAAGGKGIRINLKDRKKNKKVHSVPMMKIVPAQQVRVQQSNPKVTYVAASSNKGGKVATHLAQVQARLGGAPSAPSAPRF